MSYHLDNPHPDSSSPTPSESSWRLDQLNWMSAPRMSTHMGVEQSLHPVGKIPALEHAPMCMDTWPGTLGSGDYVAIGDTHGHVTVSSLYENLLEDRESPER